MKRLLLIISSFLFFTSLYSQNVAPFWSLSGNSNATSTSKLGTSTWIPLRIITNNLERVRVTPAGLVGIGTSAPTRKLHVAGTGLITNGLIVQKQQPVNGPFEETAITATSTVIDPGRGGIGVGIGVFAEAGLAGVIARGMGWGQTGPYGIGVDAFGAALGVYGRSAGIGIYGTSIGDSRGNDRYAHGVHGISENGVGGYFSSTNGIGLEAYSEHNYAGYFNGDVYTTGVYETSDERLKENVTVLTGAIDKINQLKPSLYEFKKDAPFKGLALPKGFHYGLIAQDVEKVFPGLVKETTKLLHSPKPLNTDKEGQLVLPIEKSGNKKITIKAVNYTELIPILVRGFQELDSTYKSEIAGLKDEIEALKEALNNLDPSNPFPSKASLKQNVPNPVRVSTTIQYHIPDYTHTARILITNSNGQQLKIYNVSGTGTVTFDVGTLPSGTYNYSLIADGKTISSKKLVIAK